MHTSSDQANQGDSQKAEFDYSKSRELQRRAHQIIPGGCHTYAKGDDQFPRLAPGDYTVRIPRENVETQLILRSP